MASVSLNYTIDKLYYWGAIFKLGLTSISSTIIGVEYVFTSNFESFYDHT